MKRNKIFFKIIAILICFSLCNAAFADSSSTTPEPYKENEFPQFLKDARRFEIITFGALPFVAIQTTFGYSTIQYVNHDFESSYFPNPFAASSYSQDEQIGILLTSLGICVGIGLTDLIIQIVKRNKAKKRSLIQNSDLMITPTSDDALKMPIPPEDGFFAPAPAPDFAPDEDGVELINEAVKTDILGAE